MKVRDHSQRKTEKQGNALLLSTVSFFKYRGSSVTGQVKGVNAEVKHNSTTGVKRFGADSSA